MRFAAGAFSLALLAAGQAQAACNLAASDAAAAGPGCAEAWMDANLRLNDILTVGTHNSYKQAIPPKLMRLVRMGSSKDAEGLDYAHAPLKQQLDDGARAIEIDVVYDPKGGLYTSPAGARMVGESLFPDYEEVMSKPGFKVMHIPDIDYASSCWTFVACLRELKTWSTAHPRHVPILVTINAKDDETPMPGSVTPIKFDTAAFDALDAEIRSVFAPQDLVTPDSVRKGASTPRDAVLGLGWPRLGEVRGKFVFALDEDKPKVAAYVAGRKSLEGRAMFVNAPEDAPYAAYLTLNETADVPRITADVRRGFLVRTRADADTVEARANETSRRDRALASGAQYVSTDYMRPDKRFGPYQARMPDGVIAACNPQRRPERCSGIPVEAAVTPARATAAQR